MLIDIISNIIVSNLPIISVNDINPDNGWMGEFMDAIREFIRWLRG